MNMTSMFPIILAVIFAPLLKGVINRVKARFAGRAGPPFLQPYYDLWKLLRKGVVYSRTTSWIFRAGPVVYLSTVFAGLMLLPFGSFPAPVHFQGDFILLIYLLGLGRFFTVIAALDTGSSFEGMGASREAFFAALAELPLLLGLAASARVTGAFSITEIHFSISSVLSFKSGIVLMITAVVLVVALLAENSRIPFDDPNTHLELTMVHEVMVLDNSGPDLAFILYGSALKFWIMGALLTGIILPTQNEFVFANTVVHFAGMLCLAVIVGIVESVMARLRLVRIPHLLIGAATISMLALILGWGEIR